MPAHPPTRPSPGAGLSLSRLGTQLREAPPQRQKRSRYLLFEADRGLASAQLALFNGVALGAPLAAARHPPCAAARRRPRLPPPVLHPAAPRPAPPLPGAGMLLNVTVVLPKLHTFFDERGEPRRPNDPEARLATVQEMEVAVSAVPQRAVQPRAPQTASEGLRPPFALVSRTSAPPQLSNRPGASSLHPEAAHVADSAPLVHVTQARVDMDFFYDVDTFIEALSPTVQVVRSLPPALEAFARDEPDQEVRRSTAQRSTAQHSAAQHASPRLARRLPPPSSLLSAMADSSASCPVHLAPRRVLTAIPTLTVGGAAHHQVDMINPLLNSRELQRLSDHFHQHNALRLRSPARALVWNTPRLARLRVLLHSALRPSPYAAAAAATTTPAATPSAIPCTSLTTPHAPRPTPHAPRPTPHAPRTPPTTPPASAHRRRRVEMYTQHVMSSMAKFARLKGISPHYVALQLPHGPEWSEYRRAVRAVASFPLVAGRLGGLSPWPLSPWPARARSAYCPPSARLLSRPARRYCRSETRARGGDADASWRRCDMGAAEITQARPRAHPPLASPPLAPPPLASAHEPPPKGISPPRTHRTRRTRRTPRIPSLCRLPRY